MKKKSKKLDQKNAKYIVKKVLNSHSMKLNTLKDINDVFYVNKLYMANTDPLFSQPVDNTQPPSIQDDNEDE